MAVTLALPVVSYSISTSNHNTCPFYVFTYLLYLIPFLHQTTTKGVSNRYPFCCILFHFYIKPQLDRSISASISSCILFHFYIKPQLNYGFKQGRLVVSYSISTSNHNNVRYKTLIQRLYLIPFLHQTTTST